MELSFLLKSPIIDTYVPLILIGKSELLASAQQHGLSQRLVLFLPAGFFSSGFALDKHALIRTSRLVIFHSGFSL